MVFFEKVFGFTDTNSYTEQDHLLRCGSALELQFAHLQDPDMWSAKLKHFKNFGFEIIFSSCSFFNPPGERFTKPIKAAATAKRKFFSVIFFFVTIMICKQYKCIMYKFKKMKKILMHYFLFLQSILY